MDDQAHVLDSTLGSTGGTTSDPAIESAMDGAASAAIDAQSAPLAPNTRPPFRMGLFVQHLTTVIIAVIAIGVIGGFAMGYRSLHREARKNIVAKTAKIEVVWPAAKVAVGEKPKTWLPEQFQEQVTQLALSQLGESPAVFSRDPLEAVGIAMEESGWFVARPRVQRIGENTIRIDGEWRTPAAVVRVGNKDLLVSWDGRMMPPAYDLNASGLCVILPVTTPHPIRNDGQNDYNAQWGGEDLAAALELLATLKPQTWGSQVAGIDVTDYAKTQQLAILTREDTRIIWGGKPSKPLIGETSTRSKLDRIGEINRRFSRIDAKRAAIDISGVHAVEINITASATEDEKGKSEVRHARTDQ